MIFFVFFFVVLGHIIGTTFISQFFFLQMISSKGHIFSFDDPYSICTIPSSIYRITIGLLVLHGQNCLVHAVSADTQM